jgi:ABC-type transport system involved in cytochrome c biogenesis ATPase subunit
MSKVETIKLEKFKAIDALEINFKGCTAIVTGGNNIGKTSFLRGITDRIRFIRPDVMVKTGSDEGSGELTLDTGEKFIWEFDVKGKDKLTYITASGLKKAVTVEIGLRFFPPTFDIDKFLTSAPKEQAKQLQKIVGIDFTDIDKRYLEAYDDRTEKNRDAEKYHVKLTQMLEVERVDSVDLTDLKEKKEAERVRINDLYKKNKETNDIARQKWNDEKAKIDKECREHNEKQTDNRNIYNACFDALNILIKHGYGGAIENDAASLFVYNLKSNILGLKTATELYPKEPEYITEMPDDKALQEIDAQILEASETNTKAKAYTDYIEYKNDTDAAKVWAQEADELVKSIEAERQRMIESAKFPKGVSIDSKGITIDGLPLERTQISTSKLYTTALRIASMNLGEVKTLYFDASFLDRENLEEIERWADEQGLQLLIERPSFEKSEIKYELIQNIN